MTWVKIDDHMPDNLKVEGLSDGAFRVFVKAICYSARNLTDGVLPTSCFAYLGKRRHIDELLDAALFEDVDGRRVAVHDYLEFNPSREQVLAKRAADAARQGKRRGVSHGVTPHVTHTAPVPDPPSDSSNQPKNTHTQTRARMTVVDDEYRAEMVERFKGQASPERVNAEIDDALGHKAAEKRNDKRAYVRVWLTRARWGDERTVAGGAGTQGGGPYTRPFGRGGMATVRPGRGEAATSEYADDF